MLRRRENVMWWGEVSATNTSSKLWFLIGSRVLGIPVHVTLLQQPCELALLEYCPCINWEVTRIIRHILIELFFFVFRLCVSKVQKGREVSLVFLFVTLLVQFLWAEDSVQQIVRANYNFISPCLWQDQSLFQRKAGVDKTLHLPTFCCCMFFLSEFVSGQSLQPLFHGVFFWALVCFGPGETVEYFIQHCF